MKSLKTLFSEAFPEQASTWSEVPDISISSLECDSRKVQQGSAFVVIRGLALDGATFIQEAIQKGAVVLIVDRPVEAAAIPVVFVEDCRKAIAKLAAAFYGKPTQSMKVIGITGTNGKTTTSYLIEHILNSQNMPCGVVGTIEHRYPGHVISAKETTPDALKLQNIFLKMKEAGCAYVAMEVSSHALDQDRVGGVNFSIGIFSNLTQDHLDYHKDMESYFLAKAKLFQSLDKNGTAIINADDSYGKRMVDAADNARKILYGIDDYADFRAENVELSASQTRFEIKHPRGRMALVSPLLGKHNVYNVLSAIAACSVLGVSVEQSAKAMLLFEGVPGRLQTVRAGQDFTTLIDFAHTPDGLLNVLRSIKEYQQKKLIVVFGCGGDRDRTKRPIMAKIASEYADYVYVTSDNPRSENPKEIAKEVCAGFPAEFQNFRVVVDRQKAIREALMMARKDDVVLIAGKGHEKVQIVGEQMIPFSDLDVSMKVLNGN